MTTFVALLRGVNVGKAKRVPMAEFRKLLAGLGHEDVATLLNSGNAVFRSKSGAPARIASDIAAAISRKLKVEVPVIVKSAKGFAAIVADNPFVVDASDHSRFLVAFTQDAAALADLSALASLVTPPERFAIGRYAAYLHCADGVLKSKAGEALLGKVGRRATTRNLATTLKLHALAEKAACRRR
jgi:uncharacterized protein (DUF1697 family)